MIRPDWSLFVKKSTDKRLTCNCGYILTSQQTTRDHWQMGHFDYVKPESERDSIAEKIEWYYKDIDSIIDPDIRKSCLELAEQMERLFLLNKKQKPLMRSVEEIKSAIARLEADIDRWRTDWQLFYKDEDRSNLIRSCHYRINALKWVLLERTTWL